MTDEGLEARIRRLEDVDAIRRLKVQYFDACDGGFADHTSHVPEEISACFADDGAWDGGPYGTRSGPAAIADFYRDKSHGLAFTVLSEPTIDVDGDRATGRWNVVVYSEFAPSGSVLVGGIHHDEYVRTPGGWRIAHTRFERALAHRAAAPWNATTTGLTESPRSP
jgi:hypothetical protein